MDNDTRPKGIRLGIIGTSLCQQNDVATSGKISHWCRGWLSWARALSNEIFVCPIWHDPRLYLGWEPSGVADARRYFQGLNAGVSGQFASQIDQRKSFFGFIDVDAVIIDAGTNDMGSQTKESIQDLREKIADYLLGRGITVIMVPILSRAVSSWPVPPSPERRKAAWINQRTRAFVQSRQNCFFWDWNKAWVDFTSANGEPRAGFSNDGIHFATLGGYAVGKDLAAFMATILPQAQPRVMSPDDLYDATHNPTGNLLTNPFLSGTSGTNGTGSSGNVATGYRSERSGAGGTVAASKETRGDGRGAYQVLTFTPGGAAGTELFLFRTAAADAAYALQPGDWVQASFEVECGAWAGWRGISMYLKDNATGGLIALGMEENGDPWPTEAWKGTISTPPLKLIDGVSTLRWRVEVRIDGQTAGTGVVKIGAVELRKVPDPRKALGFGY